MNDPAFDDAALLIDRMKSFGLDADSVGQAQPDVMRNLRRECSLCSLKAQCSRDLASSAGAAAVADYCPNEQTLKSLLGS